ncbi:hypothetical protein GCM10007920_19610 [Ciceribacter naphthalenivorans]|uniref:Uncharacterized protein n=2 Tax=Alphaproteobacteria TaxID=28211 RepID=A0A512HKW1_9HYPH|nr:hypothetical protein RNA01_30190 [Ciceribacter naphthalenivorans]GLR22174.1 hypothetical protein GCM10007920_19610 [Ciceribacter naphthalenivorans]GLT05030.1 hypothetical protein GCM10007926_19610 [Sphingomonas psychrolutea]
MNEMDFQGTGLGGGARGRAEENHAAEQKEGDNRQKRHCEGTCMRSRMTAPVSAERRAAIMRCQQFNPRPKDYVPRQLK